MTLLRDYADRLTQPALGDSHARYDEVVSPDGTLRPAWKGLAEIAVGLEDRDLRRVDEDIVRFLADDGVTYSRPGRAAGAWRLDPVPLVLDAASWAPLEIGLAQRAELLNAILVDLYGEQRLLSEGVLPPAVVLGHSGFTRVVARSSALDPRPLVLAATDLGRDAAGEWRVLADRAQAPSGIGYAMENRRVISRVMPELYREAGLHRIEPYFWALRSALIQSAQNEPADPRVVVLSPGTHSETAYDQAFIASTLGFPLVQGSDLVVRDGWVQMRVFGRLERVDVILRRVDAAWSDPLELRGDSQLGVAGLTEAVRRGRVRVVNGLGAGVLENPGLLPYMPAVCEALLGEPLRLPSVPTWWCGDPASLDHVLDRLLDPGPGGRLLVRSIDGPTTGLADLDPAAVRERLLDEPHRYVGQERLPLSQAPTWRAGGARSGEVEPRSVTLRTFTLRYGSAYRPLVGGLANVYEDDRPASSKDVWVLKGDPADPDQGLAEVLPMTAGRASTGTVPRILEDLFWFGRYAERAEDMLRLVLAAHALAEDFGSRPNSTGGASLAVMMQVVRRLGGAVYEDLDAEFRSLLLDEARAGSAAHALAGLREAASGVRDQLSLDTWRAFGATDRATVILRGSRHSHQIGESAGRMLTGVLSLQGVTASMIRDAGWHMIGVGQHLERAVQVCHLLEETATVRRGVDVDRDVLDAVLVAAESSVTHRRRYRGYVRPGGVLELLLTDRDNPRSLVFGMSEVAAHLAALPASTGSTRPERLVADLLATLEDVDIATLVAIGGVDRPNLRAFLASFAGQLTRLAEAVAELHLASGPAPRPLGSLDLVESLEGERA
ncbi:circularly permuted type 2 ATP-grasp protein [Nocardioides sp. cx-173]|uniref:circularly permuted type 2 ATP-grasp protein n=1 Tax=Nocardioides sp. cx-173 TaxID=2898796 RepID=UPI001E39FF07|nr:circularly permuted type 2 ATP-grasp protein [Nocardioides sp. cx-173]MCD4523908.1 circularly permuted type 2 ATP-grasp protein [Nocardioides sp. cx-173]UGB41773.1 circularly permuted type 2 ATP-grasp protein [Nocardioides sp. cx-173]